MADTEEVAPPHVFEGEPQDDEPRDSSGAGDVVSCMPPVPAEEGAEDNDAGMTREATEAGEEPSRASEERPKTDCEGGADTVTPQQPQAVPDAAPAPRVATTANSLVSRLAAQRLQMLAEPVLSEMTMTTIEETAKALAELRVLLAAAAAAENEDRGVPAAKAHRAENSSASLETDRVELEKQMKRLMKWRRQLQAAAHPQMHTEDVFCAVVCSLAVIRGQVTALPAGDRLKVDEVVKQTYEELFPAPAGFALDEWSHKAHQIIKMSLPGAAITNEAHVAAGGIAIVPVAPRAVPDASRMEEPRATVTRATFGFNWAEYKAIQTAVDASYRDIVGLMLYMFKNSVSPAVAARDIGVAVGGLGRRDPFKVVGRVLDRFRERSFDSVSMVHPSVPKSWDVTCRLVGFVRVRTADNEHGRVCVITDLRGRPVYTGNAIRRNEREAWDAAYKECHGSYWFSTKALSYFVGPPSLQGCAKVMAVQNDANLSAQAQQQNAILARLMRPMAELVDHIETFSVLQNSKHLDPLSLLAALRFIAFAHAVSSDIRR